MFARIKAIMTKHEKQRKVREIQKMFLSAANVIDNIDNAFRKNRVSRERRRQFWNDFVKSPEFRQKFVQDMIRDIGV